MVFSISEVLRQHKQNLETRIEEYEKVDWQTKVTARKPMADISARFWYERDKILLNLINTDTDRYLEVFHTDDKTTSYNTWPRMREKACLLGSGGKTIKVSELTDKELIRARKILDRLVDEYVEKYKKRIGV